MPPLDLLAQQAPAPAPQFAWWETPTTTILGHSWESPPYVAIPVFLGVLAVASLLVERISVFLIRRLTSRTETKVDDVLVAGLPGLVRTACILLAVNVVAHALLVAEGRELAAKAFAALAVVVLGIVVLRLALRVVDAWADGREGMRPVVPGIKLILKVAAIPVLLLTVLRIFGVPIEAFLTALGIGSLAVALALQDVLRNIFSGILLVMDQPVRAGDFVILGGGTRGTVLEIGLRSTKLRTVDNNVVILPNATLAGEVVTNIDLTDPTHAHAFVVGVTYDSDARRVEGVLRDEVGRACAEVPGFARDVPPKVLFAAFSPSSLDFRVIVRVERYGSLPDASSELNQRIHARFRAEGIEFAFPTQTVHVRKDGEAQAVPAQGR